MTQTTAALSDASVVAGEPWKENVAAHEDPRLVGPREAWWFTGTAPQDCAGMTASGVMTSLPLPDLATCSRAQVLEYFDNTWALQEVLFAGLQSAEAFYRPPGHNLRHPMIFYYGHPAALYVNKLRVAGLLPQPVNAYFEDIFETGVDEMSWDDLSKNEMRWPAVTEVHAYRATVYGLVRSLIRAVDFAAELGRAVTMDDAAWAVFMGFEHDRIHLETSSVLIRELPRRLVQRHPAWPGPAASSRTTTDGRPGRIPLPANDLIPVGAGEAVLGKPRSFPSYGWDNEYGQRHVQVPAFRASRHLVSNGEYYAFVEDGGYRQRRFWSDEGWGWRAFRNAKWPRFWMPYGPAGLHAYRLRTIFEVVDMPWDAPVCVNYHEAKAFCAWRAEQDQIGYRLITEAEHQRLRDPAGVDADGAVVDPVMRHSGADLGRAGVNLNLAHGSESPVDASAATGAGFTDVFGNVWQWCEDHFNPLPGFAVHPFYDDFSTPCFDGEHQMILGGSFASTGDEASIWARFHFRPHFLQHSGIRLAASADGQSDSATRLDTHRSGPYESDAALAQYLLLHYGTDQDTLGPGAPVLRQACGFPQRVARLLLDTADDHGIRLTRALDVGCAVGGATFELSTRIHEVVGIDASTRFIDAARQLAQTGHLVYQRGDQGERTTTEVATTDPTACRRHAQFHVADACALPADLGQFDAVLLANLLCRLKRPKACLEQFLGEHALLRPGGMLLIATPWSWDPQYTPREEWLGATPATGTSEDALQTILGGEYDLLADTDAEMVLRDHERRFQYVRPQVTIWRRRAS